MPELSLVVATRGRAAPFETLFSSLAAQTFQDFEVIVVDQNADDRIGDLAQHAPFVIKHLRTPHEKGVSRARNAGLAAASGDVVLFPDDDCWYPPHMLSHALDRMRRLGADVLSGRATDESGSDINGRFESQVTPITRRNVWTTGIEWMMLFRRSALLGIGGFDVDVGVGASTPWQACEAQDVLLRVLAQGHACWFDPSVYGHHAELDIESPSMIQKGRGYARGLGYVLRRHGYTPLEAAQWILRPMVRAVLNCRSPARRAYFANVAAGRWEGWRMKVSPATRADRGSATPEAAMPTRP